MVGSHLSVVTRIFSRLKHVQLEAEKIAETVEKDEEENGNQFLVLLKISPRISERLYSIGLNKRYRWGGATRYESLLRDKEGDQVFSPSTR